MRERRETRAALALVEESDLDPRVIPWCVDRYGSPARLLDACAVGRLDGIEEAALPDPRFRKDAIVRELVRLRPVPESRLRELEARGIQLVAYGRPGYPKRLTHLCHPPVLLYLRGNASLLSRGSVAVVGSRRATEYGRRMAHRLSAGLARAGWTIVSGMARGIDGVAHRTALEVGGDTVGVLGSGLDHRFPSQNRDLYAAMRKSGLLVSEFPPPERPFGSNFPRRNRIIAALVRAVVVVQAARRSGALNTANHATEIGRDVYAVPGPVGPETSVGVHGLLRDGAGLVTCAGDVLAGLGEGFEDEKEEANGSAPSGGPETGPPAVRHILGRLREGPAAVDDLITVAGLPAGSALALLTRLEVEGILRELPGGAYELAGVRRAAGRDGAAGGD
ncbi:MAG: DNA-processing protein DprA [Gemmatimonadota bacterium]